MQDMEAYRRVFNLDVKDSLTSTPAYKYSIREIIKDHEHQINLRSCEEPTLINKITTDYYKAEIERLKLAL